LHGEPAQADSELAAPAAPEQVPAGEPAPLQPLPWLSKPTAAVPAPARASSLAEQARELAQVKRLIDAGASGQALRELEQSVVANAGSQLSEERDALYVQALDQAHRRAEAERAAKRFLKRYPNSPQSEKMRQLVGGE
jgi:TolA-binding protein